jgi:hypothetical protein
MSFPIILNYLPKGLYRTIIKCNNLCITPSAIFNVLVSTTAIDNYKRMLWPNQTSTHLNANEIFYFVFWGVAAILVCIGTLFEI